MLGVFTHRELGSDAAIALLRALCRGLASYTGFFLAVGLSVSRVGFAGSFAIGLAVALAIQAVLHGIAQRAPEATRVLAEAPDEP